MPMKKAQAYVLLDVSIASENRVLAELIKVEGLDEAYLLRDVHDMILLAGADNTKELLSLVNGKIKAISGIRSAIVLVIKVAQVEDFMVEEQMVTDEVKFHQDSCHWFVHSLRSALRELMTDESGRKGS